MRGLAIAVAWAVGCGAPRPAVETPARSTFEDPLAADGAATRLLRNGGREQAHDVLVALLDGLVREDEAAVTRLLSERLVSAAATHHGDAPGPRSTLERSAWVHQMLASIHAARLPEDTTAPGVIEPGSITVEPAASYYPADGLPIEVAATDWVVRFRVAPAGRRALSGLAPSGTGLVVVRAGSEPRVIAR